MFGTDFEIELLACYVQEKGEQQTFKQDKCCLSIIKFLDTYYATETLQKNASKHIGAIRLSVYDLQIFLTTLIIYWSPLLPLVVGMITLHVLEVCDSTLPESA